VKREDRAMDKPWRLEGGKRHGVMGPVVVVESDGKYSVTMDSHHLKLNWNDLKKKSVDQALDSAFCASRD
jgi:hypothetical protein